MGQSQPFFGVRVASEFLFLWPVAEVARVTIEKQKNRDILGGKSILINKAKFFTCYSYFSFLATREKKSQSLVYQ